MAILLLLLFLLLLPLPLPFLHTPWICCSAAPLKALFVFGDSLLDPGNDEKLLTLARADRPPYGRDLPDHRPTGRFCNGLLTSDFIASFAGLPYPPAYLLDKDNIMAGTSFASSGAGILNLTGYQLLQRIDFVQQVGFFKDAKQRLVERLGSKEAGAMLSRQSLILVCLGNNDYLTNYFGNPFGRSSSQRKYPPNEFRNLLISSYKENLVELYNAGARKFGVVSLSAIGCIPLELLVSRSLDGSCNNDVNAEILRFNSDLHVMIKDLQATYADARFTFLDSFNRVYNIIQNPVSYGFMYGSKACCGAGPYRGIPCYRAISSVCSNASQYVFWDFAHPTQALNAILANEFWSGSSPTVSPFNLQQVITL